jgi:hypothetical protein
VSSIALVLCGGLGLVGLVGLVAVPRRYATARRGTLRNDTVVETRRARLGRDDGFTFPFRYCTGLWAVAVAVGVGVAASYSVQSGSWGGAHALAARPSRLYVSHDSQRQSVSPSLTAIAGDDEVGCLGWRVV